jgi:DNA-binding transcriptional ArsR family regulator
LGYFPIEEEHEMADEDRDVEALLAIGHPLRRRMLRAIVDSGGALGLSQLAQGFDLPVATARYHANVLCGFGVAEPTRSDPDREPFYDTSVGGDPEIEALLEETREADDTAEGFEEDA